MKGKGLYSQSFFPVVTYGKTEKAENWKIEALELWYWIRLLKVPSTARRSNQSILREINPEYSFEGLMLKLKLQYFGHLMRIQLIRKDHNAGKDSIEGEGDDRGWDG